jgi:Flp pilus assembly protein TadB
MARMPAMEKPSQKQQWWLLGIAAVLGLVLASILDAGYLASIGLVAAVGIVVGFGFAAWSARQNSARDRDR